MDNESCDSRTIQEIVRAVVDNLNSLPTTPTPASNSNSIPAACTTSELNHAFQIPRGHTSTTTISPLGSELCANFSNKRNYSRKGKQPRSSGTGKFSSKKGKYPAPKQDFIFKDICLLPSPEWTEVPRRKAKAELVSKGMYIDAWQLDKCWNEAELRCKVSQLFKEHLFITTSNGGSEIGFEFVRAIGSAILPISLPTNQELGGRVLKHITGNGPIYVRTLEDIQVQENCSHVNDEENEENSDHDKTVDDAMETCFNCNKLCCLEELPSHLMQCGTRPPLEVDSTSYLGNDSEVRSDRNIDINSPVRDTCTKDVDGSSGSINQIEAKMRTKGNGINISSPLGDTSNKEALLKEMFPQIEESDLRDMYQDNFLDMNATITELLQKYDTEPAQSRGIVTLSDDDACSVEQILRALKPRNCTPFRITVRRESIFADSISFFKKRDYDINKPVKVTFEAEAAIDGGRPRREYFTLLLQSILSPTAPVIVFEGTSSVVQVVHNTDALRASMFKVVGRMISASIVNGGPSFNHLSSAVYRYLTSQTTETALDDVTKSDVVDYEVLQAIDKIDKATVDNVGIVFSEVQGMLAEAGYPKMLTVANRLEAITALCVHSAILCRKGELDQFAVGLGPVLELAKKYPDTMNPLFVSCEEPNSCSITPEEFKALLVFESVEEKVKQYFLKYIDEEASRLPDLLMFCTGVNCIPPLGFHDPSNITVLELDEFGGPFPNANTCPQELELPAVHQNFEDFKENFNKALVMQSSGFGIV